MLAKRLIGALLVLIALLSFWAWAKGLRVTPSTYYWRKVEVGKKVKMPVPLEISNQSDGERRYRLKVVPSNVFVSRLVSFSENNFTILPRKTKKVDVYLELPKEEVSFGNGFEFYIEVKEEAKRGERFALTCYPKIVVKTKKSF
ncbi:MAG: hypothetical protein ACPL4K_03380 [Candidatus Margulisiibacteriota bacterium]